MKPVMAAAAASTEAREEELVASAQAGNAQAFEALFRRYRDRISGFVRASVRDEGRTEDLVQEIFFSAHSGLAALEHPGAFRTWLYQIARNACLDEARRRSRQDELILGWEEFPPPDERIVVHNQSADRAVWQKEELTNLTQALDGLPESQHEALVMRELEGMSYDEIGRRMRLSRPAVESVLFRARRGLKGEYADIETGRRCKRIQSIMAKVSEGMGDLRERRTIVRHLRDCGRCKQEAAALGLAGLAVPSDERRGLERAFSRLAAFLPLPTFFGRRAGETESLSGTSLSGASSFAVQAQGAAAQLTAVSADHAVSVIHKAAAVVAAVAVVGGSGVAIHKAGVPLPVKIPVLDSTPVKKQKDEPGGTKRTGAAGKLAPGDPRVASPGASPTDAPTALVPPASVSPAGPAGPAGPTTTDAAASPPLATDISFVSEIPTVADPITTGEVAPAESAPASTEPTASGGADQPPAEPVSGGADAGSDAIAGAPDSPPTPAPDAEPAPDVSAPDTSVAQPSSAEQPAA